MRGRAAFVVVAAVVGVGVAQAPPLTVEWADTPPATSERVWTGEHAFFEYRLYNNAGSGFPVNYAWVRTYQLCTGGPSSANSNGVGARENAVAALDAQYATWRENVMANCPPEPEPEPEPEAPPGWTCAPEATERGGTFCVRETAQDTYDATYTSRCGGSASAFGMTWEEFEDFADQAADALFAECDDPLEPMPPDDPAVACTGTEGVACESTLQDVRYLLSLLVQLQQQQAQQPGPVMPDAPDPEGLYVPPFDRSQPSWEGFTEPNVTDDERGALTARIGELTDELVLEAEGRLPFGLGGVVVLPTIGEAPPCTELELTLFDTSRELGWCDSAAESWLATVGRTLTLAVLTIAFGFAIVRTVAWA